LPARRRYYNDKLDLGTWNEAHPHCPWKRSALGHKPTRRARDTPDAEKINVVAIADWTDLAPGFVQRLTNSFCRDRITALPELVMP